MGLYFRHLAAQGGREHAALSGDMTTAALDITITAVTVAKTPLVFAGAAGPSSGGMDYSPRAALVNSTPVRLSRTAFSGTSQYSFFVLEFK